MNKIYTSFLCCLPWVPVLLLFSAVAFAQVPVVNLPLIPDAKAPGGGDFTLTVNGTGFVSRSLVNWNGSPRPTTFINTSQLIAVIPSTDIAKRGTATVTVVNPTATGGTSNVALFSVTPSIGHSGSFEPGSSTAVGACPVGLTEGDFNGDGIFDLASADYCSNTVSILLGDGAGNFNVVSSAPTGNGPQYLAVGDFNEDGQLDLVVVNYLDGTASILLGDGAGNFLLGSSPVTGSWPASVVVADFNRDGHLDFVVTLSDKMSVLLGDGAGHFSLAFSPTGGNSFSAPAVGDFNRDGKLDLAITNPPDTVSILLGDGAGNFNFYSSSVAGDYPFSVTAGDFNGDAKLDLAVTNFNAEEGWNSVSVLLGDGAGKFSVAASYPTGINPHSLVVSDFNGDGKLDLAVADISFDTMYYGISTLVGDGKGNLNFTSISPSNIAWSYVLAVGDFNGDGRLDLAGIDDNGAVSILLNHGRQKQTTTTLTSSLNPTTYWQEITLTATVSSGSEKPTGLVVFRDASVLLGAVTLTNGSASISLPLTAGSHSITAEYQGTVEYSASASSHLKQIVSPATTTISLTSSPNPAFANQTVYYTATVASQNGGAITGNVSFQEAGVTIATAPLSAYGDVSVSTSYTAASTHQITATFLGDSNNTVSTSGALTETIWKPTVASTTTIVTSGSPSLIGKTVKFTATVSSKGGPIPNGEFVTFYDMTYPVATVALTNGTAVYSTSSLSPRAQNIYARYFGDAKFQASSNYVKQVVLKYSTTTLLTSSSNPSTYGQPVIFSATVTTPGTYPLTGWVKFWDGTTSMGTGRVWGGVATLTKPQFAIGAHAITAQYLGDSYNAKSTSNEINQIVH